MEYKLALNYLSLSVKRKISKILDIWKKKTLYSTTKVKLHKKPRSIRTKKKVPQICLTEPSPVSSKILKKNKMHLQNSSLFNCFWPLNSEKVKNKPVPIKLYPRTKSISINMWKNPYQLKENEDIAVVSSNFSYNEI